MAKDTTQLDLIYQELCKGPKTPKQLGDRGVYLPKLTARMADLRHRLQRRGMDWLNNNGTYELVKPEGD